MNSVKSLWNKIMELSLVSKILLAIGIVAVLVFIVINFLASSLRIANIVIVAIAVVSIIACFTAEAIFKK